MPGEKQQAFAQALTDTSQSMRNFWRTLGDGQHGLTAADASLVERTLSIGAFVKNHPPLVEKLLGDFTAGRYSSLSDLARLTVTDWENLVAETGPPASIDPAGSASPAEVFARVVYTRVTRAYPTVALANRVTVGDLVGEAEREPLATFFTNNPKLELIKDSIPDYLEAQGATAFQGIDEADRAAVVANARSFQRVLRIAPNTDVAAALLTTGIRSATQIATLGEQQFFHRAVEAGLTKVEARHAYQVAAHRYATVVSLFTQLNYGSLGLWPAAIGDLDQLNEPVQGTVRRDPSLATLFGTNDSCATSDCASILSPAAYLCDLLLWLSKRQQGSQTALDVFDSRRPDVRHLLLNCPNSDTELPYIDLVIELLADAISPPVDAVSTSFVHRGLADGTTYYYVVTAVNAVGQSAASAQVSGTPEHPAAAPAVPGGVVASAGASEVRVDWAPVAYATSYNVYYGTAPGVTPATGTKVPATGDTWVVPALANGTAYYFVVTSVNAAGESAASAEVSATPAAVAPGTPAPVVAGGDGVVLVTWPAVAGADSYALYRSTDPGVSPANTPAISATSPFTDTGLVNGTTYYYVLTASNAISTSAPSAALSAVPAVAATLPGAPAGVSAVPGDETVTISWTPVPGATSYNIFWSTASGVTPLNGTEIVGSLNPRWKQTSATVTSAELTAAPEYFNQAAFATLSSASYPFTLPYSAGLDALRSYLQQLTVPLWQLRQALLPVAGATAAQTAAVAGERFGLTSHGQDLITTPNPVAASVAWNTTNPSTDVAPVDAFTVAASISYEQLLELLQVEWVQGGLGIGIAGINDLCQTSLESLFPSPLDPGFLDRAHRFLRLWIATGYKMWELDLLLSAARVAAGTLDAAGLTAIFDFKLLQDTTKLPVDRQLAFFDDIDIAAHRDPDGTTTTPLYDELFLSPTATGSPDPDLSVIAHGGVSTTPLDDPRHLSAIQAALGVNGHDAATLIGLTDNSLTVANLSLMYRASALAAAARLSIDDLLAVARLLNPTAANTTAALAPLFQSPSATLAFLAQAAAIKQASLTLDAVSYLLTPPAAPTTLAAALGGLATDVTLTVASDAGFPAAPFYATLGTGATPEIVQVTAVDGAGTTWTVTRGALQSAVQPWGTPTRVALYEGWSTSTQMLNTDIAASLVGVRKATAALLSVSTTLAADITAAKTTITVASDAGFPAAPFYAYIGSAGSQEIVQVTAVGGAGNATWTVLRGQQGTAAAAYASGALVAPTPGDVPGVIVAAVAATAHNANGSPLANDVTNAILTTLALPASAQTLLQALSDPAFLSSTEAPTPGTFPDQFTAIRTLDKAAVLVRGLRLVAAEVSWLMANGTEYGGLDLTKLPVTPGQAQLDLAPLLSTLLVVQLQRLWTSAPSTAPVQSLFALIDGIANATLASVSSIQAALATITGWQATDIAAFAQALGAAAAADYTSPKLLDALRKLEAMEVASGAAAYQLIAWAAPPPDESTAQSLADGALGVIRAGQPSSDAWLAAAPNLVNPLREHRSAALQAYLIGQRDATGNLPYPDADALFDHFLIDVQMSSCMETSRVVQAYIAIQVFVERCIMGLEAPAVVVDPVADGTWEQWTWMKRYRVWEADREVFLYPENWLIESQRPNRTEIYKKLEQEVRQGQSTEDDLEKVVLDYIERLDGLAQLLVTGTCEDGGTIYVVARTLTDPPTYYYRSYVNGEWGGWVQIPLDIKASCVVPAVHRGRLCLFWLEVKISNEPQQQVPPAQANTSPPSQNVERYVSLGVFFSTFRNGSWAPAQMSKGKLFDKPPLDPAQSNDVRSVERLYTIRVQSPAPAPNLGARLWIDVFRQGDQVIWTATENFGLFEVTETFSETFWDLAVHLGRAVFDGRFEDLDLSNLGILVRGNEQFLLDWAKQTYGPDASLLLPLPAPDPAILPEPYMVPQAGALIAPAGGGGNDPLQFTSAGALEQNVGPLLGTAPLPFRVVGRDDDLNFDPASYFFFQENRRCWWVEAQKLYWTGSAFSPVVPSYPSTVPYEVTYIFHPFYHPFTRLLGQQLASGGFNLLYDPNLQQNPDQIQPGGVDAFSFNAAYAPVTSRVWWDHDDNGQDRQFLDFGYAGAFSVYNWELFYHVPMYVASLLTTNQQFEDAEQWLRYVFDPTRQSTEPAPQRFWITKPLHNLTASQIVAQQINSLLVAVNQGDQSAIDKVNNWRANPFNPFLLADQRPVAYMKATVMAYLDNLIAWGDNLFSTESREALSEATLLYVVADEILGPKPVAVTPPDHADESFDQLEGKLDAFANAMVEIENVIGGAGVGGGAGGDGHGLPAPQTFYFKIPSNPTLLGYWTTVADRLNKLRHCQNIAGEPLSLALFDAPIDPGLLVAAQAAGADLSSVLSDLGAPLPHYRFTALYPVAIDFVNAVRAYGSELQGALEKRDAATLALLQQTLQQQLLIDGNSVFDFQIQQAQANLDAAQQTHTIAQHKHDWNHDQPRMNAWEIAQTITDGTILGTYITAAVLEAVGAVSALVPQFMLGAAGFGGSPTANASEGGQNAHHAAGHAAQVGKATADAVKQASRMLDKQARYSREQDKRDFARDEASTEITRANDQIQAASLAIQIAQQNKVLHQEQIDNLQMQIDFLNSKFTNEDLYDWMVDSLSGTYFQAYQLAYQMCKQAERCYQFELGIPDSGFIQFGYWDSLHKGLLAGEALQHDLRRLEASYLQKNARRYEISRYVSLETLDPAAFENLILAGQCSFSIPESLFDADYPGHYNRRLTRISVSVVYPSPGKYDNVKATLTMTSNKVRTSTDTSGGYAESPVGSDSRFAYDYAAVPQKIVTGNAQDDPGLFVTAIASNITDQRYLPFENAGAVSSWQLEMPELSNEIDLGTVGDVQLHLHYTALEGGEGLKQAAVAAVPAPTTGVAVFSALNDFKPTWPPTDTDPYPQTPWFAFIEPPATGGQQVLSLSIPATRFPAWARTQGTLTITQVDVLAVAWGSTAFNLKPQGTLPNATIAMNQVVVPQPTTLPVVPPQPPPQAGPNVFHAAVTGLNVKPGTFSFLLQHQGAADFASLKKSDIADVIVVVSYSV